MAARFILSLDCEGRWGVADHLGPHERSTLTDATLDAAYGRLLAMLDRLGIAATFAFVGLFAADKRQFAALRSAIEPLAKDNVFVRSALAAIDRDGPDGWHGGWALDSVVKARAGHEIALHGVTHLPWAGADRQVVHSEMALLPSLPKAVGSATTFIYPRNAVAHPDLLAQHGFTGYRLARPPGSRLGNLIREFDILAKADRDAPANGAAMTPIPAGHFVNWQHGLRRLVPQSVSVRRLQAMLSDAQSVDGVVHLWLHPENMASAPATGSLLEAMLETVARERDRGSLRIETQADYVRRRRAQGSAATT